jgi:drug/metabolite transporter (DMT)-like permease
VPAGALGLALAAACAHALWNLLLARARDPEAATAVALVFAALLFAPVAVITWDVSSRAVPYVVASAALELAYFALLAAAYARSELSLVYPLARGLAPVLVLAIAVVALGAGTSAAQVAGVLAVGAGILLVRGLSGERDAMGALLAVAVAACIAGYTLVDKDGLRYADPIPYLWLVLVPVAAGYAAAQARARGAGALRSEAGATTLVAAVAMFGAYALALAALRLAPAAAVAAVRESSVVIATALAALVLHERVSRERVAGAVLVACGVGAIALG